MPLQKQGSTLENFTFYLSLLLLAAVIGSFFYLRYAVEQSKADLVAITKDASREKTDEEKNLEYQVMTVRQQLRDFSEAIAEKKLGASFFSKFEKLIFPEIYFTKCDLNFGSLTATLSGHADNFEVLGRQMLLLEGETDAFEKVVLGKAANAEEEGVDFELSITVKKPMVAFEQELQEQQQNQQDPQD